MSADNENRRQDQPPPQGRPCPICGKPGAQRWRPFCSQRCADVDLNRWLKGAYVVPAAEEEDADADGDAVRDNGQA